MEKRNKTEYGFLVLFILNMVFSFYLGYPFLGLAWFCASTTQARFILFLTKNDETSR
jgi:hypothetical protein